MFVFQFAPIPAPQNQPNRNQGNARPEQEHRHPDLALRKAVNAVDQAAACGERAEDHGGEGEDHEEHVPHFQHAPLLLNHHTVNERRTNQPRDERRVFHRVPAPVTAPAEHVICPAPAEQQAQREEQPCDQRPAPRRLDPVGGQVAGSQRRHCKRKRNHEAREAEIQHRRVNDHAEVPQQWVQTTRGCRKPRRGRRNSIRRNQHR